MSDGVPGLRKRRANAQPRAIPRIPNGYVSYHADHAMKMKPISQSGATGPAMPDGRSAECGRVVSEK
jgi:hypothetical protein